MLILTLRTDNPTAEIGLYDDQHTLANEAWQAHRELSRTIHQKIEQLLASQGRRLQDLEGIACFAGPGSFTGLRIGHTVGNTLAYGLGVPIVAAGGEQWISDAIKRLRAGEHDPLALPMYGGEAHITAQRK